MSFNEMYDILADWVCVPTEVLDCCFGIDGCNTETAEKILYFYTGWNSFEGFLDDFEEEE